MDIDFTEFLRVMTCILIILLIVQGLDYIVGFGINTFIFILFCITFAFTIGAVYHNILITRNSEDKKKVASHLEGMQGLLNGKIEKEGMTEEISMCQSALNELRAELGLEEK